MHLTLQLRNLRTPRSHRMESWAKTGTKDKWREEMASETLVPGREFLGVYPEGNGKPLKMKPWGEGQINSRLARRESMVEFNWKRLRGLLAFRSLCQMWWFSKTGNYYPLPGRVSAVLAAVSFLWTNLTIDSSRTSSPSWKSPDPGTMCQLTLFHRPMCF